MNIVETGIEGLRIIEPKVFGDSRGWFAETWSRAELARLGLDVDFVQDNHSFTASAGTLRGLHFQLEPMAQAKLVHVATGAVLDVNVDLRKGSPTYLQWRAVELSAENHRMLFVPRGFAHSFLTLTDNVNFLYKTDNPYSPENDRSIRYDDPDIGILWGTSDPILSAKDANAPLLRDSDCNFKY